MRLDFLIALVRRRIVERYVGSSFVLFWAILAPLVPLLANLLVFYFIARLPSVQEMGVAGYAVFAFSGLLPIRLFQRAATEGSDLLIGNLEMLRSASFPLPYLSLAAIGALAVDLGLQLAVMGVLLLAFGSGLSLSMLALPLGVALFVMLALGTSWLTSIAGYVLRDIQEIVNVGFLALLYLTPAVYPIEAAPESLRAVIMLNPLTHLVIVFRDVVMPSDAFHWYSWAYLIALTSLIFIAGLAAITRLQRFVGDLV